MKNLLIFVLFCGFIVFLAERHNNNATYSIELWKGQAKEQTLYFNNGCITKKGEITQDCSLRDVPNNSLNIYDINGQNIVIIKRYLTK